MSEIKTPKDTKTEAGSRDAAGYLKEKDCPKCCGDKAMIRHNADWSCHKCGYTEVDNQGYDELPTLDLCKKKP